ncbi:WD40 repeat-like protein [Mycena sanguinolenta]|uniref:WD40 repeat-like protein n=1 Tax=Mycena sanguinolenta TaxID=230812 RepID=A0A8H6YD41_9AGAR|nr:WD40 repeat-like protein [Mycena sanguinolenta]
MLTYFLLDDNNDARDGSEFPLVERQAEVGLAGIAFTSAIDESRKLMFVADDSRAKSYAWADNNGAIYDEGFPVHTLQTDDHEGPLHVLSPGRIIRAGKGSIGVWNLDELKTHGPDGTKRVGRKIDTSDTWRDEDDEIEASSGSKPTGTISLADPQLAPARWHAHPSAPANMFTGGKTVSCYLGHGGDINTFSTSSGDPNIFLTAASDGHARLFDHRMTLPVLSLQAGTGDEDVAGIALVHPDGVPLVFTGASHDEVIRLWDVRAQKMVYELSTGNNAVVGMTWDAPRSALYVAAACEYMDRNGNTYGYRRAKVPRIPRHSVPGEDDGPMDDDDFDSEDEDDDEVPCWPDKAAHAEDYFGHLFDSGNHRLLRYAFKDQADPSVLPVYGDASINRESDWW